MHKKKKRREKTKTVLQVFATHKRRANEKQKGVLYKGKEKREESKKRKQREEKSPCCLVCCLFCSLTPSLPYSLTPSLPHSLTPSLHCPIHLVRRRTRDTRDAVIRRTLKKCVLLLQNVFSYYRMCSLNTECVLLL